uniref:RRM domain-containing protein n=1 Tax=Oryza meridionalis TaxID=40149 RepID=A0A0E0CN97_9ORYZ
MARVYVGNLDPRVTAREIEDEFRVFGVLRSVWVARKPPGFAFIDFDDRRDAEDAIRDLDAYFYALELQPTGSFSKEAQLQQVAATSSCTKLQPITSTSS